MFYSIGHLDSLVNDPPLGLVVLGVAGHDLAEVVHAATKLLLRAGASSEASDHDDSKERESDSHIDFDC